MVPLRFIVEIKNFQRNGNRKLAYQRHYFVIYMVQICRHTTLTPHPHPHCSSKFAVLSTPSALACGHPLCIVVSFHSISCSGVSFKVSYFVHRCKDTQTKAISLSPPLPSAVSAVLCNAHVRLSYIYMPALQTSSIVLAKS